MGVAQVYPAGQRFHLPARVPERQVIISLNRVSLYCGTEQILTDVSLDLAARSVTAIVGPSGSGKSSLLRVLNRMHDLHAGWRVQGQVTLAGQNIYAPGVDPARVRRWVGMVFQEPVPFPGSILDNVTFGPRQHGVHNPWELRRIAETQLRRVGLWAEVRSRLRAPARSLSRGQQQRLCIARTMAVKPAVLLMDEPTSALDPGSTAQVEELIERLREDHTVVIVTHNLHQAARISDFTVFMLGGRVVEAGPTVQSRRWPQPANSMFPREEEFNVPPDLS